MNTVNSPKTAVQTRDTGLRVLRVIPSIVYGQAVVTMAKGGAESQSYQIFCEMLEAGIVPSTMTTNNVIMELSKKGSYKVAISILDQLSRYQVTVSSAALNSLFNACDKVCKKKRRAHKSKAVLPFSFILYQAPLYFLYPTTSSICLSPFLTPPSSLLPTSLTLLISCYYRWVLMRWSSNYSQQRRWSPLRSMS